MDDWGDRELRMGTRYILEVKTNRLGDALARRDERKAGIKNDSWVFVLGLFSNMRKNVGRTSLSGTIKGSVWDLLGLT